jgi:cytochrome P450 / NADPH-cytochrome P450 reductase
LKNFEVKNKKETIQLEIIKNEKEARDSIFQTNKEVAIDIYNPIKSKIIYNENLSENIERKCNEIIFEIPSFVKYQTGYHVGIYPKNPKKEVEKLEKLLSTNFDEKINFFGSKIPITTTKDSFITIRNVFSEYLNLNGIISSKNYKQLSEKATNPTEKNEILELMNSKNNNFIKITEILERFKSIKLQWTDLFDILPKIYPRYYSISSSSLVNKDKIRITINLTKIKNENNCFYGLCSNYLINEEKDSCYLFVREAEFYLPKNPLTPIIMVAGGR